MSATKSFVVLLAVLALRAGVAGAGEGSGSEPEAEADGRPPATDSEIEPVDNPAFDRIVLETVAVATQGDLEALYDRVRPSVVRISAGPSFGTGFVVEDGTRVVTAWHVVALTDSIWIQTGEGTNVEATVERFDKKEDVAVLRVTEPVSGATPLPLSPDVPTVGDVLFAVGHPFVAGEGPKGRHKGLLEWSLTAGMVSMVGEKQIQTTVSLQPGNSGGPVFDDQGRVVGVAVERHGDFGLARKIDVVADLLASEEAAPKRRLRVLPHLAFGFGPGWMAQADENRKFHYGLTADMGVVIDRRMLVALRYDHGWLVNKEEKEAGRLGQQSRVGVMLGPVFSTRSKPFKGPGVRFNPYVFAGLGVGATGTRRETFELLDPDCNPGLGPCDYRMEDTKEWARSYAPVLGGGLRVDFGGAYLDFGATVSPLEPQNSVAIGINFGMIAGRP